MQAIKVNDLNSSSSFNNIQLTLLDGTYNLDVWSGNLYTELPE